MNRILALHQMSPMSSALGLLADSTESVGCSSQSGNCSTISTRCRPPLETAW